MYITNKQLFPLAEFLIKSQQKKLGFTIDKLLIFNQVDSGLEKVGGFYDHGASTIGLNIANLHLFRGKYDINNKLRVAAAIILEECYHAAHQGEEIGKDEDLASWYGSSQAAKLPEELLVAQGGQLYKNEIKKEKTKMLLKDIPVTIISGSMFDFINKVKGMDNARQITKYGQLVIENDAHVSTVHVTTDPAKLDELKSVLGNVTNASFEYAGMIYVYQDNEWKSYVDVDDNQMVEVELSDIAKVSLTKYEGGEHLEVSANTPSF